MSHIVASCKHHIDPDAKSLSDQQPVTPPTVHTVKSTRENKELKLTLCNRGKALELT